MAPDDLRELLTGVAARAARVGELPDEAEAGPPEGRLFRPVDPRDAGVIADWSSAAAVRWAPALHLEPRELADVLAAGLVDDRRIAAVEVAPTGWLAITVSDAARAEVVGAILADPDGYAVPEGVVLPEVADERPGSRPPGDPVAVVQLSHARQCRRIRNATAAGVQTRPSDRLEQLTHVSERVLLVTLADLPQRLARHPAGRERILAAMAEVACRADAWVHPVRPLTLDESVEPVHGARLALATATRDVLRTGLRLLGASAPERM
ncbi:anticodon-binding protein [Intrasporangium chromatireducens Q5-1]|uniref:Anticodon-binding protein n=1 Tax=Intrasporangium chromatireducens Q5-1 TaxID=584657 RepID=W9GM61_9MICO|nr:DALR anticodon-binding domain-containing protein [Intrasporangium chromatireducens]EWT05918.1 anticodon-binding protein [Intrasporangium chromatireducens Q5-1]